MGQQHGLSSDAALTLSTRAMQAFAEQQQLQKVYEAAALTRIWHRALAVHKNPDYVKRADAIVSQPGIVQGAVGLGHAHIMQS